MRARASDTVVFELWGQRGWQRVDVAGTGYHLVDIARFLPKPIPDTGADVAVSVQLIPDPENRHDRNAVKVMAGNALLGHLPAELAAAYQPRIVALLKGGYAPQCGARIRAWPEGNWMIDHRGDSQRVATDRFQASIGLDLAEPHMLFPLNPPPTPAHVVLPIGRSVQVNGTDAHMATLRPWTRPEGEGWVHVTLHAITLQLARSTRRVVEVRLDGDRVGQLTPKMSGEFIPAVEALESVGLGTAVRAVLKGNALKADVNLFAVRSGELSQEWLAEALSSRSPAASTPSQSPELVDVLSALPSEPSAPPAGWYLDPFDGSVLRWWDGAHWTDGTHPNG
ncbi:DUF2510 domain-containing protein [Sanguibacter suarezii]|uniref:DUF2510 domain-containing protein n=1 Tax=Sanguibacter suarezii TaxID=60921 RepID=UPI001C3F3F0E|nr:DUF2510 domain-containing protein [Sanguibacter suarezii]